MIKNNKGFTLTEVMIAFTIFAVFAVAFLTSQGQNVESSRRIENELIINQLALMKIKEVALNPPELNLGATLSKETKSFEGDYSDFQYTIEIKKLTLPDFSKFLMNQDDPNAQKNQDLNNLIFTKMKENVEKIVWQLKVTVTNKITNDELELSRWITNRKAEVELNFAF